MDVTYPTPIRVLIVDDHPLVRRGLTSLLNGTTDIKVVGAASDGEEAVAYAVEEHPDIVLMDISMPGMNGFEALRRMLKAVAGTKVVMLTSYSEHDMVVEAIDNGAVGFLLKDTEPPGAAQRDPVGGEGGHAAVAEGGARSCSAIVSSAGRSTTSRSASWTCSRSWGGG